MSSPNILLVILDSVRARNMSVYGYERETTPFLEEFSGDATIYTQARSPSVHSIASHASIFTGLHVDEHHVTEHGSELDPEATIWQTLSADHGYETGLFTSNFVVPVTSNLADPFESVDGPRRDDRDRYFENALAPMDIEGRQTRLEYLNACLRSGKPLRSIFNGLFFLYWDRGSYDPAQEGAHEYVSSFLDWSASVDGPWAACVNLMDAHYPYVPSAEYDVWGDEEARHVQDGLESPPSRELVNTDEWWKLSAVESLYDGCIRQMDAALEVLISELRERGDLDDTFLVITADHGEGFGERSRVNPNAYIADHSWGIHEVLTHVPLVVRDPDSKSTGQWDALASLTNFPAVVQDAVTGGEPSFAVKDYALASTHRLKDPDAVLPSCDDRQEYAGPWRALYEQRDDGVVKHIERGDERISLLVPNVQEAHEIEPTDSHRVTDVFDRLTDANVRPGDGTPRELEEDAERQLEALGYLR